MIHVIAFKKTTPEGPSSEQCHIYEESQGVNVELLTMGHMPKTINEKIPYVQHISCLYFIQQEHLFVKFFQY